MAKAQEPEYMRRSVWLGVALGWFALLVLAALVSEALLVLIDFGYSVVYDASLDFRAADDASHRSGWPRRLA